MRLDDEGFPEPTGEFETLDADSLVLALGQDTDLSLLDGEPGVTIEDGVVEVSPTMMASPNGIFAGGDAVPSERTATVAIGHGKHAALGIDAYLAGHDLIEAPRAELATFDHLNTWYYADAPRSAPPRARGGPASEHLRRGRRGPHRGRTPCSRLGAACRAATASSATTASASARTTR